MSLTERAATRRLSAAGVKPTRQRMALAMLIWRGPARHFTAEQLRDEARAAGDQMALATIYNNLLAFQGAGLLGMVGAFQGARVFDSNPLPHAHLVDPATGELADLPAGAVQVTLALEALPALAEREGVQLVLPLAVSAG